MRPAPRPAEDPNPGNWAGHPRRPLTVSVTRTRTAAFRPHPRALYVCSSLACRRACLCHMPAGPGSPTVRTEPPLVSHRPTTGLWTVPTLRRLLARRLGTVLHGGLCEYPLGVPARTAPERSRPGPCWLPVCLSGTATLLHAGRLQRLHGLTCTCHVHVSFPLRESRSGDREVAARCGVDMHVPGDRRQ